MQQSPPIDFVLRSDLQFTVHHHGESIWYAVHDPTNGKYIRIGRQEYVLACSLNGHITLNQLIAAVKDISPDILLTEQSANEIILMLASMGLLRRGNTQTPLKPLDSRKLSGTVWGLLYTRIPIIKGRTLQTIVDSLVPLVSVYTLVFMLLIVSASVLAVANGWQEFMRVNEKLFVADGRIWWIVAWFVLKMAHELAHAVAARCVGCEIRSAGISFLYLAPIPFVDVSDLWTISNRWHRILVSGSGVLVEITIAAVFALISLSTDNEFLQYFSCAVATLGVFTTLAFNANPLARFDGYFIVADLLNRPNLWMEASIELRELFSRVFGGRRRARRAQLGLLTFGLCSYLYRMLILLTLALWCLIVWQGLGVVVVLWGAYAIIVAPTIKSWKKPNPANTQAGYQPKLSTIVVSICLFLLAVLGIGHLPSPIQPAAPGWVYFEDPVTVRAGSDGIISEVFVKRLEYVEPGTLLAKIENPELIVEVAQQHKKIEQVEEQMHLHLSKNEIRETQAQNAKLASLREQLGQLESRVAALDVVAPRGGQVVWSEFDHSLGQNVTMGTALFTIAEPQRLEVTAMVTQDSVDAFLKGKNSQAFVFGSQGQSGAAALTHVDPRGSDFLREPYLAATYGGPINVHIQTDNTQHQIFKMVTPRFESKISLPPEAAHFVPGQLVWVRAPNHSIPIWQIASRWLEQKWDNVELDSHHE
ncbi:MAG: HlyD family efflux transporter periplasmic adaptor subunit [Planctomycetales bacterium]|nr:HlyD family efflux transporter periplasmic adaptor subunit [Planctomycetales bacterium]